MGNFDQLFYEMQTQIKHRRLRASDVQSAPEMTSDEKKISFLNKYFIFKKVRDVNAEEVSRVLTGASIAQVDLEMKNTQTIAKPMIKKKPVVKKKKAKLKIGVKSTDVAEPVVEEMEIVVEKAPGKSKQVVKVKKRKGKVKVKGKKPVVVKTKGKVVVKGKRKVKIKKDDNDDQ